MAKLENKRNNIDIMYVTSKKVYVVRTVSNRYAPLSIVAPSGGAGRYSNPWSPLAPEEAGSHLSAESTVRKHREN